MKITRELFIYYWMGKMGFFFYTFFAGLLSGFDSERFDCIFATVKTTESAETHNADNEFSIAAWTRRLGAAIQSFILQRHNTSVSLTQGKTCLSAGVNSGGEFR